MIISATSASVSQAAMNQAFAGPVAKASQLTTDAIGILSMSTAPNFTSWGGLYR